jgi:hypothetical protein
LSLSFHPIENPTPFVIRSKETRCYSIAFEDLIFPYFVFLVIIGKKSFQSNKLLSNKSCPTFALVSGVVAATKSNVKTNF